ncbi:hypothetical protein O181_108248 [Austropuccinia psidii MF-1]|uniref:Uncharacterized protein n=1 Tax=Austropuccinia psidii MF-1 TaxID=1389203 RepID=A0A9Q3PNN5_9BASI|nr:hypothetical protein [Austropuccinia psidii MF-1]
MPFQNSPLSRQTRSQARAQALLTPTPRAPLDGTPAVPQLRAKLDRGPILEGASPSRKEGRGPRRLISFSGVLVDFQKLQGPFSEVLGKRRRIILWERKGLMVLKVFLLLWGHPKVLEDQL